MALKQAYFMKSGTSYMKNYDLHYKLLFLTNEHNLPLIPILKDLCYVDFDPKLFTWNYGSMIKLQDSLVLEYHVTI